MGGCVDCVEAGTAGLHSAGSLGGDVGALDGLVREQDNDLLMREGIEGSALATLRKDRLRPEAERAALRDRSSCAREEPVPD
jgi:hypothetical protein|eukprot:7362068-Prymnesium_polylepis.2